MQAQNNLLSSKITVSKLYERADTSIKRGSSNNSLLKKVDMQEYSDDETLSTCSGATSRYTASNNDSFLTSKYNDDIQIDD